MAYREVTMVEVREALRQWLLGVPKKRIASSLGLDPKTVRRYCELGSEHGVAPEHGLESLTDDRVVAIVAALTSMSGRPRGDTWQRCIDVRDEIASQLGAGVKLTKIRRLLARRGDVIPYATLHRFAVEELRFGKPRATVAIEDGEPGVELQVDTAWLPILLADERGRRRRLRVWIFTPSVSRYRFAYPCFDETTSSAIEACEAAWSFYGGVFRALIPDNTKAIVAQHDPHDARITEAFLEYAQSRGFVVDPARARRPTDKARVERSVQYVRDDCFGGEKIRDLVHAREHALVWCRDVAGMRAHSRTLRLPREHFDSTEQRALLAAPTEPYEVPHWCEPKVGPDHYAQVQRALYSLPTKYIGKRLRARADSRTVRFYDRGALIKTHARKPPGSRATDVTDFPDDSGVIAGRTTDWLVERGQKIGESVARLTGILLDAPQPWTRMRRVYALHGLATKYGAARLDETCALAIELDMHDVKRLERMLERGVTSAPESPPERPAPPARFLRSASEYALPRVRAANDQQEGETT
jgi:transposase